MNAGADRLRPAWGTLPAALRTQIVAVIGGDFVGDEPAHGGFSASYAGVVTTTAGRGFVKACGADWHADSLHFLREEMHTLAHLPSSVAPRLLAAIDGAVGTALVIEAVDGHHPGRPWTTADLQAVARALGTLSTTPAPSAMPRAEESMIPGFTRWQEIAADAPLLDALPHGLSTRIAQLLSLEHRFRDALHGDVIVHDDVRSDNILISDGRAHLLDWPHARRGAAWIDLPCLLPSIEASGGPSCEDAWALFEEHGAPPQTALLPVIAAFASFLWYQQAQPEIPQLPGLREFQRAQADPALRWLAALL
ncbi:aminoglycoside phosphotransferase family protein [Microbacterium sp. NPDC091662]|uniref:aminoglycoside phosphotransferase family protein n=1 Tax=Microbacterium sp. NPDC091662 TaxID=3364211 RepID=UPI00380D93B8